MGLSSSSSSSLPNEGDHFIKLIQSSRKQSRALLSLVRRSRLIRKVQFTSLWQSFLSSSSLSFVLTPGEAKAILLSSMNEKSDKDDSKSNHDMMVNEFIELILDLSDGISSIDLASILGSIVIFDSCTIEEKIDRLFFLIALSDSRDEFTYEEFCIALLSFERGLSHCLGFKALSESYIRNIATQWVSLADPLHRGVIEPTFRLSRKNFIDFCVNRQHVVRRLLEELSNLTFEDSSLGEQETLGVVLTDQPVPQGDQWMANSPWKKISKSMVPSKYQDRNIPPSSSLSLEWIHGYRGFDCRNNIFFYSKDGFKYLIYFSAGMLIAQEYDERTKKFAQYFFGGHIDDIISIAFCEMDGKVLVASGEIGKTPSIFLSLITFQNPGILFDSKSIISGYHEKGVSQIAFSRNGSRVFTVGTEYSIAVYDSSLSSSNIGKMIWCTQGPKGKIFHSSYYGLNGEDFVTIGEKHICCWAQAGPSIYKDNNIKLGNDKNKSFSSVSSIEGGALVVGSSEGDLILISGCRVISSMNPVHKKSITAMWSSEDGQTLITGGSDGRILIWKYSSKTQSLSLCCEVGKDQKFPSIRSLSCLNNGSSLVIGTNSCDLIQLQFETCIFEVIESKPSFLNPSASLLWNSGHYKGELWGIDVRPNKTQYCTVGDDGCLRLWDLISHERLMNIEMNGLARCCCFSSDGTYLAVGFGSSSGNEKKLKENGMVRIYRVEDKKNGVELNVAAEIKEAKQAISCVRFSPDGVTLAVGSRDNAIYFYSVIQQFKRKSKFSKHNAGILQLDFSKCGMYVQSCCSSYEILYSKVSTGQQVVNPSVVLQSVEWESWTCTLGWPVLGIWAPGMDGSDINAVDRSSSQSLIATGDDLGKVKLFSYPAPLDGGNIFTSYSGHSSHVTNVKWISNQIDEDSHLISLGGNDKSIFVWRRYVCGSQSSLDIVTEKKQAIPANISEFEVLDQGPPIGDEFLAVKPWLGAIFPPTAWIAPDPAKMGPYLAAIGELASRFNEMSHVSDDRIAMKAYDDVIEASRNCFARLSESGVNDFHAPDSDELDLEWVFGYRGFDSRSNCHFISSSSASQCIVYPAASLGVVISSNGNSQRYFRGHTDDILSLVTFQDQSSCFVATGQVGIGNILVWDPFSLTTLATIKTNQKSIYLLAFSLDGKYIASVAEDKTIAITNWRSQTVLVHSKGETAITSHCIMLPSTDSNLQLITCGDKFIKFWSLNGRNLTSSKISTSTCKGCSVQMFYVALHVQGKLLVGADDGYIYCSSNTKSLETRIWNGKVVDDKKIGSKSVLSMFYVENKNVVIAGTKDGRIVFWSCSSLGSSNKLDNVGEIYIDKIGIDSISAKQIQSLSAVSSGDVLRVLATTRGCDILEISVDLAKNCDVVSRKVVMRGHYHDELWGLAVHPFLPEFCTVGDDMTIRFYSIRQREKVSIYPLGVMSRCCSYSPDGKFIALGCGGRVGRGKEASGGLVRIYSNGRNEEFVKLVERRDAKQWTSDIKFSNDGKTLVVSSHDCKIYIYEVLLDATVKSMNLKFVFSKHNAVVTHIDLSMDNRFLMSNCAAYELLFSDIVTGKQITHASELRDVKWATWTCPLGWASQGVFQAGMDGSDINAVDRSHSGHLIATGDDFGKVRLFRYPCVKDSSEFLEYRGHSSHVMNVRWSLGDEYLISCGGNDKCVMLWKHSMTNSSCHGSKLGGMDVATVDSNEINEEDVVVDIMDSVPSGGDEFLAVKPWLGAIRAPKCPPPISDQGPDIGVSLKWIHGYTSMAVGPSNTRVSNNLFYGHENSIVYPAAALGVTYYPSTVKQRYMIGHDDDIMCLTISQDRRFIATGQIASKASKGKGSIFVWDTLDGRELCRMSKCHLRGIANLAFNKEGNKLVSVGLDDNNTHILWSDTGGNWSKVQKVAEEKGNKGAILFSMWINPENPIVSKEQCCFLSGGSDMISFWILEGSKLSKKPGRFGKFKQSPLLCAGNIQQNNEWKIVVGTSTGDLYVFESRDVVSGVEKAHSGAILTIAEGRKDGPFFVTGGKDKMIKVWNQTLQAISSFNIAPFSILDGSIASLDIKPGCVSQGNPLTLLVGTSGGEIVEVCASSENQASKSLNTFDISSASATVLVYSHFSGELWGLAPHPTNPDIVVTVGDDSVLRIWSISKNAMVSHQLLEWPARCVAWHPTGTCVAVGFHEAVSASGRKKATKSKTKATTSVRSGVKLFAVNPTTFVCSKICEGCSSLAWIQEIKFSPNGLFLAACSHDKNMYVFSIPDNDDFDTWRDCLSAPKYTFSKHSSAVLHVDFSSDCKYFMTNCQAGELLFGHLESGVQETSASKLADYNNLPGNDDCDDNGSSEQGFWFTQTCKLGWPVQGIFPPGSDLSDINAVDRDISWKYLATSDDFGEVKIYRFPCIFDKAKAIIARGHSSHVTNVRWTASNMLISVGGNDKCVFIWDVEEK